MHKGNGSILKLRITALSCVPPLVLRDGKSLKNCEEKWYQVIFDVRYVPIKFELTPFEIVKLQTKEDKVCFTVLHLALAC
jgi:hypothetical protein